jgi:enoyl-CoA hydratase/carnithine racemase
MLRTDDHGRVRLLTLDRPEALNAFNTALYDTVAAALDDAAADGEVAVVVLTGSGRAFSAGQDLAEMATLASSMEAGGDGSGGGHGAGHGFPRFMDALIGFPKPLIAAVNGLGVGLGLTIVGHCDLTLVADTARFRPPFTALGVVPEAASSYTLPAMMGWQRANAALLTSAWIDADEAVASGLALRKVALADLVDEALALATEIAVWPISSLVGTKRVLRAAHVDAIAEARRREDAEFADLVGTPANLEALTAFLEKRPPDFTAIPGE